MRALTARLIGDAGLARNTGWVILGHGLRTLIQAVYFIVIARALQPDGYGAFVAAVALIALAAPFVGLGSGNLLIKHVARVPARFSRYWGLALVLTGSSGILLATAAMTTARLVLPENATNLVLWIALGDLLFVRLLDVSAQAFQAFERLSRTAQLQALLAPCRLVAALVLVVMEIDATALVWSMLYAGSSAVAATIGVWVTCRELGRPSVAMMDLRADIREGLFFAISLSAQNAYNDIDKTMLARLATVSDAGIYAVAYRLIDIAFVPVRALLYAAYARFFQSGLRGVRQSLALARRLLPIAISYAVFAALGLFVVAPILPVLLGNEYATAAETVRWLALLPLLRSLHYFAADALTGAGFQELRTGCQILVALINVGLNVWLIPQYSWLGAVYASLASDALLAALLWISAAVLAGWSRRVPTAAALQGRVS